MCALCLYISRREAGFVRKLHRENVEKQYCSSFSRTILIEFIHFNNSDFYWIVSCLRFMATFQQCTHTVQLYQHPDRHLQMLIKLKYQLTLLISLSRNDVFEESTTMTNLTLELVTYPYLEYQLRIFGFPRKQGGVLNLHT